MSSPFRQMLGRSVNKLRQDAVKAIQMDATPGTPPVTLFSFNSALPPVQGPEFVVRGSDIDIGGLSTCNVTHVPMSTLPTPPSTPPSGSFQGSANTSGSTSTAGPSWSHIAFNGNMSLRVPTEYAGRFKSGYAGMRSPRRKTLFGEETWDLSMYTHLKIVVGYRGWEGWRARWYCNVQTDGPVETDLFQHRLFLPPSNASTSSTAAIDPLSGPPASFTALHLPLPEFVLTNSGQISDHQIAMMTSRIRTVGFSLLGGGRGEDGMPLTAPASPKRLAELRGMASGGWGGGGTPEPDPEIERMLAEDGLLPEGTSTHVDPVKAAGYHRVGAAGTNPAEVAGSREGHRSVAPNLQDDKRQSGSSVQVKPWSQGYYELCIKSVQAVNRNQSMDDEGAESIDL